MKRVKTIGSPVYDIGGGDGEWFPVELGYDGAPIDGSPYDYFDTEEKAIECVKRIGGVLKDDFYNAFYMDKSAPFSSLGVIIPLRSSFTSQKQGN